MLSFAGSLKIFAVLEACDMTLPSLRPAGKITGTRIGRAGFTGPRHRRQILRPPAALPAGTNLSASSRRSSAEANFGEVDGTGGGLPPSWF